MFLRQLEYLTVLARERHFGRAAQACNVSQPALSVAIRKLERELGVPLVHRHHRYDDLTPEGHTLLHWAQQVQAGVSALASEAAMLRDEVAGTLRLGVIPPALSVVSLITGPLLERHPKIRLRVFSLSSTEIERGLADLALDAGVTYLDNEPLGNVDATPIYQERYVFLSRQDGSGDATISWSELRDQPLCLLTTDMQARRIIDAALADAGVGATPRIEADSITALLSFARAGWSCVMARTWLAMEELPPGTRSRTLTDPVVTHEVGLITRRTELHPPVLRALQATLPEIAIDADQSSEALTL